MLENQRNCWPLSAAQEGIWSGQQLSIDSPMYNTGECIEIHGALDLAMFELALRQVIRETESLQVRFVVVENVPQQKLDPLVDWKLHIFDLSQEKDPWEAAQQWMQDNLKTTVDLSQNKLFQEVLFQVNEDRFFWYQRIHHVAIDGFGFSLIARRVSDVYSALVEGHDCPSKPFDSLSLVVEEDLAYQRSNGFERDREFWCQRFFDQPDVVTLTKKEVLISPNFIRETSSLAPEKVDELTTLARSIGENWPELLIAATAAYLHDCTRAEEIILGLPVMGRLGSVSLRIPSMVMNIVPLRVSVDSSMTLLELTKQVSQEIREIRPHQRYRYEQVRRDLKLVGGTRRLFGPVINIMPFDYHLNFAGNRAYAHNISAGPVEDLSIGVYARSDGKGLRIDFDANPACYGKKEIAAHQQSFLGFLNQFCQNSSKTLGEIQKGESTPVQKSILNGGELVVPARNVVELILEQSIQKPEKIALEEGRRQISYGKLVEHAKDLAAHLIELGAEPNQRVAVALPRSVDAVVSILAVLISGTAYLPLDPNGPRARSTTILDNAAPDFLLCLSDYIDEDLKKILEDKGIRCIFVDQDCWSRKIDSPNLFSPGRIKEEHLAYVIYTSGSTGKPNGVAIHHGALANFVAGAVLSYPIHHEDRVLQFAPLYFDASVEEIFLTLCAGATLVLRNEEMMQSIPQFLAACEQKEITVLDLPTAFWHELAYSLSTDLVTLPAKIQTVIIGGEAVLPERVIRWLETVGDSVSLLNTYGPTEATVVAAFSLLKKGSVTTQEGEEVPIGLPLPGVRAVVVGARNRVASFGKVGELCLIGKNLAQGYLHQPKLTESRFITLDTLEGNLRAYRTGDLVRQREDGQLLFVGRVDDEFKISGHRVNPIEVETLLLSYPKVRDAAVVGQALANGVKRLSAHLVVDFPTPSVLELRQHLLSSLNAAVIPSTFSFCDTLPKTPSGKIDRKALKSKIEHEESSDLHQKSYFNTDLDTALESISPMEQKVLTVWEQVLGRGEISIQDDFFEIGGQSLQTIQVANRLSMELGREIPVAIAFRYPTIEGFVQYLEKEERKEKDRNNKDWEPGDKKEIDLKNKEREDRTFPQIMLDDMELSEKIVPSSLVTSSLTDSFQTNSLKKHSLKKNFQQVLLTGATGFVGVHLLHELLLQTRAKVCCLVRAKNEKKAKQRIQEALEQQELPFEKFSDRIVAIPADLTLPKLGLNGDYFLELAANCEAIYHNAAVVSVIRGYSSLRAANVESTNELLHLASLGEIAEFHYISTHAVAPPLSLSQSVPEEFFPIHEGLRDGYQQSKWVAENLIRQAGERGLPTFVYRLGRVVGSPETGLVNQQDLVWRILQAGIPAKLLPELNVSENWTPVDYIGKAIVHLSCFREKTLNVFNLTSQTEVRLQDIFQWVQDYGYPVELCSVPEWRARLEDKIEDSQRAILAFFDLQAEQGGKKGFSLGQIHCKNVEKGLERSGIECPNINRSELFNYLNYCVEKEILSPPNLF